MKSLGLGKAMTRSEKHRARQDLRLAGKVFDFARKPPYLLKISDTNEAETLLKKHRLLRRGARKPFRSDDIARAWMVRPYPSLVELELIVKRLLPRVSAETRHKALQGGAAETRSAVTGLTRLEAHAKKYSLPVNLFRPQKRTLHDRDDLEDAILV